MSNDKVTNVNWSCKSPHKINDQDLCSSRILHILDRQLVTDVAGQPTNPTTSVASYQPPMRKIQKSEDLIYITEKLEIMQWKISISLAEAMIRIYRLSISPLINGSMVA